MKPTRRGFFSLLLGLPVTCRPAKAKTNTAKELRRIKKQLDEIRAGVAHDVPIRSPFPHVARQVVRSIPVRAKWRGTLEAVLELVLPGELACQAFTINSPSGNSSSPQVKIAPSGLPRAANSHSASVETIVPSSLLVPSDSPWWRQESSIA